MKHKFQLSIPLIFIAVSLIIGSCAKKELPAPFEDKSVTENIPTISLVAPCESILVNNRITSSESFEGYSTMYVSVTPYDHFDYLEVVCSHYSSSNRFNFKFPNRTGFRGKIKYSVKDFSSPYNTVATVFHSVGSYSSFYFDGTEGFIYAEYTSTNLILTFCDVTVTYSPTFHHTISGKITVPL
jgi:hypothetical protein